MEFIYSPDCLLHRTGSHPECKERLLAFEDLPDNVKVQGEPYLELVHSKDHIEKIRQYSARSMPLDGDTLTSVDSFKAATAAVGATITAAESGGFALVRPPGHHAYPQRASGFCLFNNVAISVRHLKQQFERIMILDIDGHLGDGTSAIFYDDPKVLFCSLHQFPAFPGTGWVDELGSGPGQGFTVNLPLPPGSGDDIFWQGMTLVDSIAKSFNPQVVAVSAGFDAHQLDPLLQLRLSLGCYYECGLWLRENFSNFYAVLEGGYNLNLLPKAIKAFRSGCNGEDQSFSEPKTTSEPGTKAMFNRNLDQLHACLKDYWAL